MGQLSILSSFPSTLTPQSLDQRAYFIPPPLQVSSDKTPLSCSINSSEEEKEKWRKSLMEGGDTAGPATCAAWIRQSEKRTLVVVGRARYRSCPPVLDIFEFNAKTTSLSPDPLVRFEIREEGADPLGFAVHPSGDEFVCSTANGCRLYDLDSQDFTIKLIAKDLPPLQSIGPQKCLAFSTDGLKFAVGGEDGHLRIFQWPTLNVILDEPKAHKSFRDMDISLDSEFLVSTSTDGSARIWKINDGVPLVSLTRTADEKIECCRFSRDGTKPFLFCTVQKGSKATTAVWDISTWNRIGYKRLLGKPTSVLSTSLDGKYLGLGSKDGDMCIVEVKTMGISHLSKKLHLGTSITSLEFCPKERVVLSASNQWGVMMTKLNVPADWKEWQIYLVLLGLFLASLLVFYVIYENSDSFWNFPLGKNQPARPSTMTFTEPQSSDDSPW
ncbi:SEC12-like protein 1 isoform X2 [Canna indica]|uniref:SEC12-like protein 1 isoform X2 n=1 Tax=Canna indica TaxID=4628 RepID=A0AAQ3KKW4_9LILI|nr:SEC12-like protein 1 isoform X2 [Canna indica]